MKQNVWELRIGFQFHWRYH